MAEYKFSDYIEFIHLPGEHVVPHKHDYFELIYYIRGEGTTNLDTEEAEYKAHTMQIVKKNVVHFEKAESETEVKCVGFDCVSGVSFENTVISKNKNNEKFFDHILGRLQRIEGSLLRGEQNVDLNDEVWHVVLSLSSIVDDEKKKEGDFYETAIKNVRDYIKVNYNKTINFAILCESIGYSYDWFRHVFKEKTGVSMKKYQQGLRVSSAKIMLTEKNLSVKEIARRCGFKSDVRFIDYFKKTQAMTPKQYRKASRNSVIRVFNVSDEKR